MKSLTKRLDLEIAISEFIEIQSQLIDKFKQSFPEIKDLEYLSDCPRHGEIEEILGEKWHFQRHGVGICFTGQKSGKVIDVHTGIFKKKILLDSWILFQYFDSINL